ncbi:MAG TPA: fused MFS/spermidine synthase [Candidatus Acidoferrum sp.]|nr:fused MFS/spermidine synthase [Candidatus Acidoferrum sp.]
MIANPADLRRLVLFAVGALGVSCVMTQLALLRELLGAFSGNEMVLGITLGLWLLLMGIGTTLGRTADRLKNPLAVLFLAQILVALLPLAQVLALRGWRNAIFIRGAEVGVADTVFSTFVLLLPYCVVAGYALTLACSILNRRDDRSGAGRVYAADSLGSVAGGVVFSFVLIRFLDHFALLTVPAMLNLLAAAGISFASNRKLPAGLTLALATSVLTVVWLADLDGFSTGWLFQKQHVVERANSPYGKLVVTESDGQFDFIENGIPLTSTRDDQHVEEAVHYALAQRPEARKVLLIGGGISGTGREILKYSVSEVDYVELDPLLLALGRKYLSDNLADSRIRVINTDGRLFVKRTGDKYDTVIVDVPDPSTAQLNRFYTAEFFAEIKQALAADGVLSFSLGHYENYVSPELARLLASARRSLQTSFTNILVLPGGRVFFLVSDGPLFTNIAARVEQRQVQTRLVNGHYLDAMLTADRLADIQRAVAQPAAVNRDFSPMLYFYHLRHWLSQFNTGFGFWQAALLVGFGIYLARLRGAAVVLFASGFAGSALEFVLLLAFQVLCGSVYHQVGVIVTVFMAGLALGALLANRSRRREEAETDESALRAPHSAASRRLAFLAIAIAGFAVLLPFLLPWLNRMGGSAWSLLAVKGIIALLTLGLAALVGLQFPLANRLEDKGSGVVASRLYTADFVGAALGALLASTWLIPVLGVTGVCLLTAGLNLMGGAVVQFRKTAI